MAADSDSDGHLSADRCPKEHEHRAEILQKWELFKGRCSKKVQGLKEVRVLVCENMDHGSRLDRRRK